MAKHSTDLITISKLYLTPPNDYRKYYDSLKPCEESEAMRRGREIHASFEFSKAPARELSEPLIEDKTK